MTTAELEQALEAGSESPSLEFKGPISWSVELFAKDILAMTNTPGGGRIVVGVDDGTFERIGLNQEQCDSYQVDIMRDQMTGFADPHVLFEAERVSDSSGKTYVVIQVHPFQEVPVICRKNHPAAGTRAAVVYFRGSHRRPESAPVATSYDMRTIMMQAAARMMRRMKDLGFAVASPDAQQFDDELEGL